MLERVSQDDVLDALRRRGLWDGKAREASQAGKPRALVAERETSLKPSEPMKTWRNAGPWVRGFCSGHVSRDSRNRAHRRRGLESAVCAGLWHWPTQSRWPAMLARVALASGAEITTHQTFVRHDGSAKAPLGKQARLFAAGGRTIGGGVWFGVVDPDREFIVGEGIEATLSAMRIFGARAGCAALSAFGIRTLVLPSQARRVRISTDHDEHGQGLDAAREAARRWLGEGRAVVASISPRVGEDANDVWLRKRA